MENRYLEVLIFSDRGITAATIVTTTEGSHKEYDYHNNIKECCTGTTTAREKTLYKKKKNILIVDDEPDITSLFRKVLIKEGFSVDVYNNPADSLKNFKPHFYDLVILDIVMPGMDGFRLYNQLRKADPDIKICS